MIRFAKMRKREGAGPVTVGVDLSYLGTVLRTARGLWRLGVRDEMVREARVALGLVGLVGHSRERRRRPTPEELEALTALWRANGRQGIPMVDLVEFAIASAMRLGEICRLRWEDLDEEARTIVIRDRKHPREKRGNDQEVALLDVTGFDALGVIRRQGEPCATREGDRQPPRAGQVFPYKAASVGTAFARACRKLGIEDLTFHDLRHEGVSRLFEAGLRLEQVALISGHRDWSMLRRYTQLRSRDLTAAYAPRGL